MSIASSSNENAIWSRVIHPERGDMSPEVARYFLGLQFEQGDLDRIRDLTAKSQAGTLSGEEEEELQRFRRIGLQIDLLRSKARLALRDLPAAS